VDMFSLRMTLNIEPFINVSCVYVFVCIFVCTNVHTGMFVSERRHTHMCVC